MKLEKIGFYTLSDKRAREASEISDMKRCEMIITDKCNFKCPYCRGLRKDIQGELSLEKVKEAIDFWVADNLENIRFSGGEPCMHSDFQRMIAYAKEKGVKRIAISTNGSMDLNYYKKLIEAGVNDISISLDACCSAVGRKMSGGISGAWEKVVYNIMELSKLTYVSVGMVFTPDNMNSALDSIRFAHSLGVADIRIISSAQYNDAIAGLGELEPEILDAHPILKYRVMNYRNGRNVRGIQKTDSHRCGLMIDDSLIAGKFHFPCIIYMRERGDPIGLVGPNMRAERAEWSKNHDTFKDPICRKNCLDICVDYNVKYREFRK